MATEITLILGILDQILKLVNDLRDKVEKVEKERKKYEEELLAALSDGDAGRVNIALAQLRNL